MRSGTTSFLGIGAILTVVTLVPRLGHAAPCPFDPEIANGNSAIQTTQERIDFLEARLAAGAHNSRAWALGWGVSLGALAVGQAVIAPFTPADERPEWWVGAGASAFGALTRAVFVPRVFRERRKLAKQAPTGCDRVAALEGALLRSARWERQGRGLLMHALSLGFNAGVGVLLGVAFDRPVGGNRLAAIGGIVGEVMIITQPSLLLRSLDEYGGGTVSARKWLARPWVARGSGGLAIRGRI